MPWLKELIQILKKERRHASFFEWPRKDMKELGVVKLLFESMQKGGACPYSNPRFASEDPPDCVAQDKSGYAVGIEVSELVDFKTVRDAEGGKGHYKYWEKPEVLDQIRAIISTKDQKQFHGGPYSRRILVVFTDEPFLDPDEAIPYLQATEFPKTSQIDEIYLLFSYDPRYQNYPFVKLKTADN